MLLLVNILNIIQDMFFYFGIKIYSDFNNIISSRCTMSVMFIYVYCEQIVTGEIQITAYYNFLSVIFVLCLTILVKTSIFWTYQNICKFFVLRNSKVKTRICPCAPYEVIQASRCVAQLILHFGTTRVWVVSFTPCATLLLEKEPLVIHWIGGCVGPRASVVALETRYSPLEFDRGHPIVQ
jgi:hypothetical protein